MHDCRVLLPHPRRTKRGPWLPKLEGEKESDAGKEMRPAKAIATPHDTPESGGARFLRAVVLRSHSESGLGGP